MKSHLNRIDDGLGMLEEMLLALAMVVMLGATTLVILSRYFRELGMGYTTDLAVGMIPWVGMLGASVALKHGRHIGMMVLRDKLAPNIKNLVLIGAQLVIILFLAIIIWTGSLLVTRQITSGVTTAAMELPRWMITLSVPLGAALALFHQFVILITGMAAGHTAESHETFVANYKAEKSGTT